VAEILRPVQFSGFFIRFFCMFGVFFVFFSNYTLHKKRFTHTHPSEHTCANPTLRVSSKSGPTNLEIERMTKSPQVSRCRREHRVPLKSQTPLNTEKFTPTESRTRDLSCYRALITSRMLTKLKTERGDNMMRLSLTD
jgi:hypothetical protein